MEKLNSHWRIYETDEKIYKQNLLENIRYLSKKYVGELYFSWTTTNKLLKTTSKVLPMVLKKTGCPQHVKDLFFTEDNLVNMGKAWKSCNVKNYFQKMRYKDIKNAPTSKKILTPADKVSNTQRLNNNIYQSFLGNDIWTTEQKQTTTLEQKSQRRYQNRKTGRHLDKIEINGKNIVITKNLTV